MATAVLCLQGVSHNVLPKHIQMTEYKTKWLGTMVGWCFGEQSALLAVLIRPALM